VEGALMGGVMLTSGATAERAFFAGGGKVGASGAAWLSTGGACVRVS
jgi:hypothetical protein